MPMKFGPVPPKRLPVQDPVRVLMLAERWQRAAYAQQRWAERAKQAVDFFEGRQWTEGQLAAMARGRRPALTFNIIAPIVRLVLGYQRNNKTDIVFKPGHDTRSSDETATTLSGVVKALGSMNEQEFVDCEVFLDGLVCARGFFDTRLDWETNDLGECRTRAADPFSVYPDPDGDTFNLNETCSFVQQSKWVSLDEIEGSLGRDVAELIRPFTMGQTPLAPVSSMVVEDEVTPRRFFGEREDVISDWWDSFYSLMGDFVDRHRKTIRVIESQYKIRELRNVMIDLESGDKKVLPVEWGADKIEKALLYAEMVQNPCIVQQRMVESVHWTTMAGDLILYDAPSFYDRYTLDGYYPYFRRGMTRGMVEDLIDPQKQKNKLRSGRTEVWMRTANGGWKYHEDSLDPVQERNLKRFGATPGVNIKWKGAHAPEQIEPNKPPVQAQLLEDDTDEDVRRISGINESALGENQKVQSGKALEARQRQAVVSVQMYYDNFKRAKMNLGRTQLGIIQNYYTEQRLYRIKGEDGKQQPIVINQKLVDPTVGVKRVVNDVTLGKYAVEIDDAPLSATFAGAQFDEMMSLLEKFEKLGPMLPLFADLIIGMSSMPRKDEWIERFAQINAAGAAAPPPGGGRGGPPGKPVHSAGPEPAAAGAPTNVVPLRGA